MTPEYARRATIKYRLTPAGAESHRNAANRYYRKHRGSESRHHSYVKQKYGLNKDEFIAFKESHKGACGICRKEFGESKISIDHCHKTGKVRGIVHQRCNTLLAMAGDSIEKLESAIIYLKNGGFCG